MKRTAWWMAAVAGLLLGTAGAVNAADEVQVGVGANYWVMLDDIDVDEVDEEGFGYLVTLQLRNNMVGLGFDVEMMPERFGEDAYAGQAYIILGEGLYVAPGIGINNVDGDFAEEPFYNLRVGLNVEVVSGLYLDINANYRFNEITEIDEQVGEIDTDTIFLGAALRLQF
ncbi:MAG: hypothetical protein FJ221_06770 [Lentisphaerae bacterium]|nr:hypothetical protein [Lentisphaerota bacterium]